MFYATILHEVGGRATMYKWIGIVIAALFLTACGNETEETMQQQDTVLDEKAVSYELAGDDVQEVTGLPKQEKQALLAAFDEYMAAFNAGDLDRYMATISDNPQGFDYDEYEESTKEMFATYHIRQQAEDVTIIDYERDTAQIFANVTLDMKEVATTASLQSGGRQVTVFAKEDDAWEVTSIYFIGNEMSHVGNLQ